MRIWKGKTWRHQVSGVNGSATLFGVNIFDYQWRKTGKTANVHDPSFGQAYRFPVYTVVIDGQEHEFVAGEFGNGVWGFYLFRY